MQYQQEALTLIFALNELEKASCYSRLVHTPSAGDSVWVKFEEMTLFTDEDEMDLKTVQWKK